ncbi:sulfotransferase [Salinisphaera sp. SPP-AMP-43]|uniref:sulfotransferase n=1 Tax=Salinisphaera sp. SPP-AMP-43 TaxID=3121288 RepID=UPI003C6DEF63
MTALCRVDALRETYYRWRIKFIEAAFSRLPVSGLARPVFVVGCGRSGKSTLAGLLSRHPEVLCLDEPRHLWFSAFPQADIWTSKAIERRGRIALDGQDYNAARARRLRRLFRVQAIRHDRSTVLEELAINSFRLPLIREVFPQARFIHVYRNGLEVAELIQQAAERGGWFGTNDYKWQQLAAYAALYPATADLPELCDDFYDRGLLEWRLSTEAVVSFFQTLPRESYLEINSKALFDTPGRVVQQVYQLLGLTGDTNAPTTDVVFHRSSAGIARSVSAKERLIGGDILDRAMCCPEGLVDGSPQATV